MQYAPTKGQKNMNTLKNHNICKVPFRGFRGVFLGVWGLFFLFLSCENTLEFRGRETQPLLVVNAFVTPDSVVRVHVSASRFFLAPDSARVFDEESGRYVWQKIPFETISDATVAVTQNGSFFSMQNIGGGYYISTEKPDQNGEIHIEVTRNGFTTVSASTSFPPPVPVSVEILNDNIEHRIWFREFWHMTDDTVTMHKIDRNYERRRSGVLNIRFSDPPNVNNFYRLLVTANHYTEDGTFIGHDQLLTPWILREHLREMADIPIGNDWTWPLYLEFSDEVFDGKEFSIDFNFGYWNSEILRPDTTTIVYQLKDDYPWAYNFWSWWEWEYEYRRRLASFNGRSIMCEDWSYRTERIEIVVELQSISREFYLYLHSREQNRTSGGFFSEPVPIFNNINGGIGIFAGYTSSAHRFVVTPEWHPDVRNSPQIMRMEMDFSEMEQNN